MPFIELYFILVYGDIYDGDQPECEIDTENDDPNDSDYEMESRSKSPKVSVDYKKRTVEFALTPLKSGKPPSNNSVLHAFKLCKSPQMLRRWKEQITKKGLVFSF